ncbi:hypothetical protein [Fodinicola acaciae]|uniref:hypothetical protein n=1 Tax=Fodinicola acaciae TaxID=2681555 RepID=UPI0013D48FCA|nr:hypothetical protein [Fodinicola acaciae]
MSFALVPLSVRDARAWLADPPQAGHRYRVRRPNDRDATVALAVFAVADDQPLPRHRIPPEASFHARPSAIAIAAPLAGASDMVTVELADTYVDSHHAALVLYGAVRQAVHALGYQRLVARIGYHSALRSARWQWQRIDLDRHQATYGYLAPGPVPSPAVATLAEHHIWPRWWRPGSADGHYPHPAGGANDAAA